MLFILMMLLAQPNWVIDNRLCMDFKMHGQEVTMVVCEWHEVTWSDYPGRCFDVQQVPPEDVQITSVTGGVDGVCIRDINCRHITLIECCSCDIHSVLDDIYCGEQYDAGDVAKCQFLLS